MIKDEIRVPYLFLLIFPYIVIPCISHGVYGATGPGTL